MSGCLLNTSLEIFIHLNCGRAIVFLAREVSNYVMELCILKANDTISMDCVSTFQQFARLYVMPGYIGEKEEV